MTTFSERGLIFGFVDYVRQYSCDRGNNFGRVEVMDKVVPKLRIQVDALPSHVCQVQARVQGPGPGPGSRVQARVQDVS